MSVKSPVARVVGGSFLENLAGDAKYAARMLRRSPGFAYDFVGPGINLTGGERPEEVKGIHASSGYFNVFGASVAQGRVYTAEEDRPGGPHLVSSDQ